MIDINICVLGDGFVKAPGSLDNDDWVERLNKAANAEHGPITFYNLGIDGETSADILARLGELTPRMPAGQDNRLVLAFGVADTLLIDGKPAMSSQDSIEALKAIILKTRSHYKMLMVGPHSVYDPQQNIRIRRLNGLYRELCAKARVPYINVFSALVDDVKFKRELVKGDKQHLGSYGHEKVFELITNDRAWWFA